MTTPAEQPNRVQWSLRAILAAVTVVGGCCALWRIDKVLVPLTFLLLTPAGTILFCRRVLKLRPLEACIVAMAAGAIVGADIGLVFNEVLFAAVTGGSVGVITSLAYGALRPLP